MQNLATEKSDIDIFVDSGLKGISFFGLLEDVVNATGKDIDLINMLYKYIFHYFCHK